MGFRSYFDLHSFLTWEAMWYWLWYLENLQPSSAAPKVGLCFQGAPQCLSGPGEHHKGSPS